MWARRPPPATNRNVRGFFHQPAFCFTLGLGFGFVVVGMTDTGDVFGEAAEEELVSHRRGTSNLCLHPRILSSPVPEVPDAGCVLLVEATSYFMFLLFCSPDRGLMWLNYNTADSLSLL